MSENIIKPQNIPSNKDQPSVSKQFGKTKTIVGSDKMLGQIRVAQSPSGSISKRSMSGELQSESEKKRRSAQEKTFIKMQLGGPSKDIKNILAISAKSIEGKNPKGPKRANKARMSMYVKPTIDTEEHSEIISPGPKLQRPTPTRASNIDLDRARRASKL